MNTSSTDVGSKKASGKNRKGPQGPVQWAIQIFGELLITVGLILILFVAWQLWWTNIAANQTQDDAKTSLSQEFAAAEQKDPPKTSDGKPATETEPPVPTPAELGSPYGIVYIPRFSDTYSRPIAEGTTTDVLDTLGLGHYTNTAMPGEVGNFSLAGHRQTNGAVLDQVEEIQNGDRIYVQTVDGFYTYKVYETKIVLPTQVDVIAPNPDDPTKKPTERLMTLTTCHPRFGSTERYIVHAKMEKWQPLSAGVPDEIKKAVESNQ